MKTLAELEAESSEGFCNPAYVEPSDEQKAYIQAKRDRENAAFTNLGIVDTSQDCPICKGSGSIKTEDDCQNCDGTGLVYNDED